MTATAALRKARTPDVPAIHGLIEHYAGDRILLAKERVQLYEDVQDFWVADLGGRVVGCGAVHPLWEDIAEIRTVAVDPSVRGQGVGRLIVDDHIRAFYREALYHADHIASGKRHR